MRTIKSEPKIRITLPSLTKAQNTIELKRTIPLSERIGRSQMLLKEMKAVRTPSSSSSSDGQRVLQRLDSGKGDSTAVEVVVVRANPDKRNYIRERTIKEALVGEEAVRKFYQRYKGVTKAQDRETFLRESNTLTNIVGLLAQHNFPPRRLDIIKLHGEEATLDLRQLSLGHSQMGTVIAQLMKYMPKFESIDLSLNRIDSALADTIIRALANVKRVNLSHNYVGMPGCVHFSQLFLHPTTQIIELNLEENKLLDNAGAVLVQNISQYGKLRKLNLSHNYLGMKTGSALKRTLTFDQNLAELYLAWNEFNSKAVQCIFEGICLNSEIRVLDFSWNTIAEENIAILADIFTQSENLIHADFSFCEIGLESVGELARALNTNHTLFGVHFEGNSGYVNYKGFLVQTEKEHTEYPLPLIKGVVRKIDGLKAHPLNEFRDRHTNAIKGNPVRDVCWICSAWQEQSFLYPMEGANECYLHLEHEGYEAVKMEPEQEYFETSRMCPLGPLRYFFTVGKSNGRIVAVNTEVKFIEKGLFLKGIFRIVNIQETQSTFITVRTFAYYLVLLKYKYYLLQKILVRIKKKIKRERKADIQFKNIEDPALNLFLTDGIDRDNDTNYILKCIDFDIENSKISRLLKDSLSEFKMLMASYYQDFKDTFYFLSRNYVNVFGIYSIDEQSFERFLEEQKYVSKRVTHAKIMLKLYSCLSTKEEEISMKKPTESKIISRPQLLEFLVRLAIEKWCTVNPKKKKEEDKKEEDKKEEEEEENNEVKKLILPLPLMQGLERTQKTLRRFAEEYRASNWRKRKYFTPDAYFVLTAYNEFLNELYSKYASRRPSKAKELLGLMTLPECKRIMIDAGLRKAVDGNRELEVAFAESKRLEISDGVVGFGLTFEEFQECLARYSEKVWLPPLAAANSSLWENEVNRINTPLFLRFESLVVYLYKRFPEWHNRRLSKLGEKGIFEQEIEIVLPEIERMAKESRGILLKMNTMEEQPMITLAEVVDQLKYKYANATVLVEDEIEEEVMQVT